MDSGEKERIRMVERDKLGKEGMTSDPERDMGE